MSAMMQFTSAASTSLPPAAATIPDVLQMAEIVAASGLFPAFKTPQAAAALMLLCRAKGLDPMTAVERYHIVQGRPVMRAEAMLAEFLAAGGRVEWHERSESVASATFSHPQGGSIQVAWTIEQAKAAGLTGKDAWRQYARQMLHARCVSEGVRSVFPGVTNGLYTPEEAADMARGGPVAPVADIGANAAGGQAPPAPKDAEIIGEAPPIDRNWLRRHEESQVPLPTGQSTHEIAAKASPSPRRSPLEEAIDGFVDLAESLGYPLRNAQGKPSRSGLLACLSQIRGAAVVEMPGSAGEWATACQELTDWHSALAQDANRGEDMAEA